MSIKISDSIKLCNRYDKLFHPRKTIKNGLIALRKLNPPILLRFRRIDYLDRLNIPAYKCKTDKITEKIYPASLVFSHKSYGKGKSLIAAKASALMELIERFSCRSFLQNDANFLMAAYRRIKNRAILEDLILALPKKFRKDSFLCHELTTTPLRWAKSFSLTQKRDILFPIDLFNHSTTGFASGNCIEEAMLQGICERLERHLISIINEKRLTTPLINVDSIDDVFAKKIISKFNHAGIKLFIKDFSLGYGIPTIGILAYDSKGARPIKIYCAAGTSLNKNIAMARALTEIAQHRAQTLVEKWTSSSTYGFPAYKNLEEAGYLINSKKTVGFAELPTYSNKDFKAEIEIAVRKLKNKGFEIIVTDATHPIIKIPTVIVAIPGMQFNYMSNSLYLDLEGYYRKRLNNYSKSNYILKHFFKLNPSQKNNKNLLLIYGEQYETLRKFNCAIKIYKRVTAPSKEDNKDTLIKAYRGMIRCYANLKKQKDVFTAYQKLKNYINR